MSTDPAKAKSRVTFAHPGTFYALAADATRLYAGSDDGAVHVIDPAAAREEPVARWTKHDHYVRAACLVAKPTPTLVTGSYDRTLVWWDVADGKVLWSALGHE